MAAGAANRYPDRRRSSAYGFAAVDHRGRIADRIVFGALGWPPGTGVTVHERAGLVVVTADRGAAATLTPQGHLRVPLPVRRWCGLIAGSRVLLVAVATPDAAGRATRLGRRI
jgi:hypothetical protein